MPVKQVLRIKQAASKARERKSKEANYVAQQVATGHEHAGEKQLCLAYYKN